MERCRLGIELERPLELARRVVEAPLARRQLAQRGVGVGGVGVELQRVFVERLRAAQITLQRAHVPEPKERRQVFRIGRSRDLVPARRLVEPAIVLVDGAEQVRPAPVLRQQSIGVLECRRRRIGEVVHQVALAHLGEALAQLARIDAALRRQAVETRTRLGELVLDRGLDVAEVGMRDLAQRRQLGRCDCGDPADEKRERERESVAGPQGLADPSPRVSVVYRPSGTAVKTSRLPPGHFTSTSTAPSLAAPSPSATTTRGSLADA